MALARDGIRRMLDLAMRLSEMPETRVIRIFAIVRSGQVHFKHITVRLGKDKGDADLTAPPPQSLSVGLLEPAQQFVAAGLGTVQRRLRVLVTGPDCFEFFVDDTPDLVE